MYIVSAYTPDYKKYADSLEASLIKQGITKYCIYPYEINDTWAKKTQIKPMFLLQTLDEKNEPVMWIDADADVFDTLEYFVNMPPDVDIACYYLNTKHKGMELLSGTLYFGNTINARKILIEWQTLNESNCKWDQVNLETALKTVHCNKVIFPSDYIIIDGTYRTWQQDYKSIKIFHKQASREMRRQQR